MGLGVVPFGRADGLPDEGSSGSGLDAHLDILPDSVALLIEDDDLILLRAAEELLVAALTEALDQYLYGLAHVPKVALQ